MSEAVIPQQSSSVQQSPIVVNSFSFDRKVLAFSTQDGKVVDIEPKDELSDGFIFKLKQHVQHMKNSRSPIESEISIISGFIQAYEESKSQAPESSKVPSEVTKNEGQSSQS